MAHSKTAWFHIRRSPYQSFAAILIMTVTFFMVSLLLFFLFGSSKLITYIENQPRVSVFFNTDAKQSDIDSLKTQLLQTGKVASIKFVSQKDAYTLFKAQHKNEALITDLVTADILPSSFEISTYKIEDLIPVATVFKASPIVHQVVFSKDVVDKLRNVTNGLRMVGVALIVVLSLVSVVIMMTIISVKISQKREEIEVMRLLGATKWYVSMPFIMEAVFYGMSGAFIGWLVSSMTLVYATPFLSSFLQGTTIFPIPFLFFIEVIGFEFIVAMILGIIASGLAVKRYLK